MTIRFFYHYPETHGTDGDMLDAGSLRDVAAAAERSGFAGFSLTEHPVPGGWTLAGIRAWTRWSPWVTWRPRPSGCGY